MRISVAICTWNRADSLARTLQTVRTTYQRRQAPAEILVVNNNCTDHTDAVIQEYAATLPLRRLFEPAPGLSHARNAAIEAAKGDYVIWTDDDVSVDPSWLSAYECAFEQHPDAVFWGGPIIPLFEGEPPAWLLRSWTSVGTAYAARDFGRDSFRLQSERLPYGANFAVRTAEQRAVRYDPRLGRQPGDYWLVGEEQQVLLALLAQGAHGWWVPGARVQHRVPPHRQTTAYLRRYFAGCGRTEMLLPPIAGSPWRPDRPLDLWRAWIKSEVRYRWLRVSRGPEDWVPVLALRALAWGRLIESTLRRSQNPLMIL